MEWSLTGLPLPIILRPLSPLTDDELLLLSRRNDALRIEKHANGDISVVAPVGCPEFVIEILSESHSRRMRRSKMLDRMDNGAQLAWMIDPHAATLTIYRPSREPEVLEKPDFVEADGRWPAFA